MATWRDIQINDIRNAELFDPNIGIILEKSEYRKVPF